MKFNDKDTLLPILIQDRLLNCVAHFPMDEPFPIRLFINWTKKDIGLPLVRDEELQQYLFNTTTVLINITTLSIFIYENKIKIKKLFRKYKHNGFSEFNKKKVKSIDGKERKYSYLLSKIRTAFSHYNYEIYYNGTIKITNKKFDKKEILINPDKSFKTIINEINLKYEGYIIENLKDNVLTISNFNKHLNENDFEFTIHIDNLNMIAGELIDLVYTYFELQDKENKILYKKEN